MNTSARPLRALFYVQHLSGVGHYVRTLEIAKAMSRHHQVWMLDGGQAVPSPDFGQTQKLALPRIQRRDGKLVPVENGDCSITATMVARKEALAEAIARIRPHVVVIEHYPFSKWELADEIGWMLKCARDAQPTVKVICSVRDIPLQTRHEACPPIQYADAVVQRLNDQFDALMVHSDPKLARLDTFFTAADRIRIPVEHTGIVAERLALPGRAKKTIIVSAGGGKDAVGLLDCASAAWHGLRGASMLDGYRMQLFGGLGTREAQAASTYGIEWRPFSASYLQSMRSSSLSISCAGYNTCANILSTGCRAILVPNVAMSDQIARAKIMQGLGIPVIEQSPPSPKVMAESILDCLEHSTPHHEADLNGANRSAALIASLAGWLNQAGPFPAPDMS